MLVYGGDICDRYEGDFRVISDILLLKRDNIDSVVLIQGNRDVNKLRLVSELLALPPLRVLLESCMGHMGYIGLGSGSGSGSGSVMVTPREESLLR